MKANSATPFPQWHLEVPSLPCQVRSLSRQTTHRRSSAVRGDEPKSDAVEQLLDLVAALPFGVAGLLCDCRFYNGACIQRLPETAPVILSVIR